MIAALTKLMDRCMIVLHYSGVLNNKTYSTLHNSRTSFYIVSNVTNKRAPGIFSHCINSQMCVTIRDTGVILQASLMEISLNCSALTEALASKYLLEPFSVVWLRCKKCQGQHLTRKVCERSATDVISEHQATMIQAFCFFLVAV